MEIEEGELNELRKFCGLAVTNGAILGGLFKLLISKNVISSGEAAEIIDQTLLDLEERTKGFGHAYADFSRAYCERVLDSLPAKPDQE